MNAGRKHDRELRELAGEIRYELEDADTELQETLNDACRYAMGCQDRARKKLRFINDLVKRVNRELLPRAPQSLRPDGTDVVGFLRTPVDGLTVSTSIRKPHTGQVVTLTAFLKGIVDYGKDALKENLLKQKVLEQKVLSQLQETRRFAEEAGSDGLAGHLRHLIGNQETRIYEIDQGVRERDEYEATMQRVLGKEEYDARLEQGFGALFRKDVVPVSADGDDGKVQAAVSEGPGRSDRHDGSTEEGLEEVSDAAPRERGGAAAGQPDQGAAPGAVGEPGQAARVVEQAHERGDDGSGSSDPPPPYDGTQDAPGLKHRFLYLSSNLDRINGDQAYVISCTARELQTLLCGASPESIREFWFDYEPSPGWCMLVEPGVMVLDLARRGEVCSRARLEELGVWEAP